MKKQVMKRYSEAFKRRVVGEYEEGHSVASLQAKYGITGNGTIGRWVRKDAHAGLRHELVVIQRSDERDRQKVVEARVRALGEFAAFRGETAIPPNSWRRAKARQLFQLLLTFRHASLDRDQILEYLWPGTDPTAAGRNFKVTLNSLYHVLEPERAAGEESAIIFRDGSVYGIRPGADIELDAERFAALVAQANAAYARRPASAVPLLEAALDLYRGDYLPEALYETWAAAERERLAVLFLSAADRLAALYLEDGRYDRAIEVVHRLLAADDCWERAWRYLMLACHGLGDRGQIARVYQRCVQTLREELDVSPAEETTTLFYQLTT